MKAEQIYTGCLAQGSYYIESNGKAAIIDPLREISPYVEKAEKNGVKIKYVVETHFHAAFFSDQAGKDYGIFTGDTLFIGNVGRPDLAVKSELTEEQLAGHLYASLRNKIMPLADDVIVFPAHGAGSACGKNMSKETTDLLGNQKKNNYALRADMPREEFVKEETSGLLPPPGYFPLNVKMNRQGAANIDQVLQQGMQALSPEAFEAAANETGVLVLDARSPAAFARGFIPGAIHIGIDGNFAPCVGTPMPETLQPILLVTEEGRQEEVMARLTRVGYDHAIGYLEGGFTSWQAAGKETDAIPSISADEFARRYARDHQIKVIDVREPGEYESEHVATAQNAPLDYLNDYLNGHLAVLPKTENLYLHCAFGNRSMIAASFLKAQGFDNLVNVAGGFKAIAGTAVPRTAYVCPSTLK